MGGRDWTGVLNLGLAGLVLLLVLLLVRGAGDWFWAPPEKAPAPAAPRERVVPAAPTGKPAGKGGDPFRPTGGISPVAVPDLGITILGVVLDGEDSFVLARTAGRGSEVHKLYPGSRLGPYRLEKIGPETVVFAGGGRRREIRWRRFAETAGEEAPRPRRTLEDISRIPGGSLGRPPRPVPPSKPLGP